MQFRRVHENIQLGIKISKKAAVHLFRRYFSYRKKSFLHLKKEF